MFTHLLFLFLSIIFTTESALSSKVQGAWKTDQGVVIFSGKYFAFTAYSKTEFLQTYGGSFELKDEKIGLTYEFNTKNQDQVGTTSDTEIKMDGESMYFNGFEFEKIDDGSLGKLAGAWLFSNRIRNGKLGNPRSADNPRKTMKILSGTRFQWIAYNVESKEFMGTGGGTYTATEGKYIENIDFFSRDNSRVGATLEFDFERNGNDWHHKGFSSKGDPIYEIWSLRD